MGRIKLRENRSKGFTVAEMLIVVGVIAVLLGIAIPAVVSMSRSMQMSKLDATARQIFIAAQNRLTALRASDTLGVLTGLQSVPEDAEVDGETNLFYVTQNDTAAAVLLPVGAIEPEVRGNQYVIELNPESASVYAVFYAETAFAYNDVYKLRDLDTRKARTPRVGYYGGAAANIPDLLKMPEIKAHIENDEELALVIENPDTTIRYNGKELSLQYSVTIEQVHAEENAITLPILPTEYQDGANNYRVVLDTLLIDKTKKKFRFASLTSGSNIVPGADIRVCVSVSLADPDQSIPLAKPSEWHKEVNSLFASRKENTVSIACGRHLQNLDQDSGVDSMIQYAEQSAIQYISEEDGTVQVRAIDWSYYKESNLKFTPIHNENLQSYDGKNLIIQNLDIANGNPNLVDRENGAGLFARLAGSETNPKEVQNVVIIDPKIQKSTVIAGALAGHIEHTKISNCAVYLSETERKNENSSCGVVSDSMAGGLIGSATECEIQNSFAALPKVEGQTAGGLIGNAAKSTVQSCYADTTEVAGDQTGGLFGAVSASTATDCYTVGRMTGETQAGFAAEATGMTAERCYSAATFDGLKDEKKKVYAFAPSGTYKACRYLTGAIHSAPAPAATDTDNQPMAVSYEDLAGLKREGNWGIATKQTTFPYQMEKLIEQAKGANLLAEDSKLSAEIYPFPRLSALPHYNDWPIPEALSTVGFVYYEKRASDGHIGVSGFTLDGKQYMDKDHTLQTQGTVYEDGYALVGVQEQDGYVSVGLSGNETNRTLWLSIDNALSEAIGTPVYPVNINDMCGIMTSEKSSFLTLTYEGISFYFDPCTANSVATEMLTSKQATVRTARQLNQISRYELFWDYQITQELNIDYQAYDQDYKIGDVQSPIGTASHPFSGQFSGGGHRITGLGITGAAGPSGLFGYNTGNILDVTFVSDPGKNGGLRTISGTGAVGGLVGENYGMISGCASAGFVIQGGTNCGGLVGINHRTIISSYADQSLVSGNVVGGFVSGNYNGTITSCYALGLLSGTQNVGGFVGLNNGTIEKCYSASHATNTSPSSWLFGPENTGTYSNCYGLKKNGKQDMIAGDQHKNDPNGIKAVQSWESMSNSEGMGLDDFTINKDGLPNSYPYSATLKGQKYPFPTLFTTHYGDWPVKNADAPEAPVEPEKPQAGNGTIGVAV